MTTPNPATHNVVIRSVRFSPVPGSYNPSDVKPDPDYYINISFQVDCTHDIEAVYFYEKEATEVRLLSAGFICNGVTDQTDDIIEFFPFVITSLRDYAEEKAIGAIVEDMEDMSESA